MTFEHHLHGVLVFGGQKDLDYWMEYLNVVKDMDQAEDYDFEFYPALTWAMDEPDSRTPQSYFKEGCRCLLDAFEQVLQSGHPGLWDPNLDVPDWLMKHGRWEGWIALKFDHKFDIPGPVGEGMDEVVGRFLLHGGDAIPWVDLELWNPYKEY